MNRTNQESDLQEWIEGMCRFALGILAALGWMAFLALVVAVFLTGCAASIEIVPVPEPLPMPEPCDSNCVYLPSPVVVDRMPTQIVDWPIDSMSKAEPVDFSKEWVDEPRDRMPTRVAEMSFKVLTVPRLFVRETCLGSNVVSVLYFGEPGIVFDHEGQLHMIPSGGSVELITNERGKWPLETDSFGMLTRAVQ